MYEIHDQNEQIVTKYRSWCGGSHNGVDGLQTAAPPTGHTEDERQEEKCDVLAGHSASKYGMSYRRALESLDCGQSPPPVPALLPARATSSYCSGGIKELETLIHF